MSHNLAQSEQRVNRVIIALFCGVFEVFDVLPFVKQALSRICVVTWARGGTPGNLPRGASVRR
jgi:hypothetical protein